MRALTRIEIDPTVCNGRPVIKGTRIPVTVVLDHVAEGLAWNDILQEYPELSNEDIHAAIEYARRSIESSDLEVIGGT